MMKITQLSIYILLPMFIKSGCTKASLSISPDRSQFFRYESVSLSCEEEQQGSATGWRVIGDTSGGVCVTGWRSSCIIKVTYSHHTGVYLCESDSGQRSDAVNITVTAGDVILESPVLPVTEGEAVTLRCRHRTTPSNFTADFYKDGSLIGTESTGEMTIRAVSKSDEGLYKCINADLGESLESWLAVRGDQVSPFRPPDPSSPPPLPPPAPIMSLSRLICHLVVASPYLLCTIILVKYHRNNQAKTKEEKSSCDDVVMETSI